MGDPGEGDASQWATVPALRSVWDDAEFMVLASDVIYPAGDIDESEEKFYRPYLAAIGGDIHNYQRYPVDVGRGRVIQYVVSGGGGAFMHETHTIPRVDLPGVERTRACSP